MADKNELSIASAESVALQIAGVIADREKMYEDNDNYRANFLKLYAQCVITVRTGRVPESVNNQ